MLFAKLTLMVQTIAKMEVTMLTYIQRDWLTCLALREIE